jgi:hypothetical protein
MEIAVAGMNAGLLPELVRIGFWKGAEYYMIIVT